MSQERRKRISVKMKSPNPLFEKWLIEWRDDAIAKDSKLQYTFKTALSSLRKYPLCLETAKECRILKGFGDTICKMLDKKLLEYRNTEQETDTKRAKIDIPDILIENISNEEPKLHESALDIIEIEDDITDLIAKNVDPVKKKTFTKSNSTTSVENTTTQKRSQIEDFSLLPFCFNVILYVDNQEISKHRDILLELSKHNIKHEVKDLKVGDFVWVCRDKQSNNELVLPYAIERKRMDDLAKSIKDKRYYEQKFRLKRSGIDNLIYLVESHGQNRCLSLPLDSLLQAATNTAIQENFFVKFTSDLKETVQYLVNFTGALENIFKAKMLKSCSKDHQSIDLNSDVINLMTFKQFNLSSIKNKAMTITDLFTKMLIQINGMSVEKALSVTQKFSTPNLLRQSYLELSNTSSQEKLLANLKNDISGKTVGSTLSNIVYQTFNKTQY
ncbi:hypothetical protein ABEB36_008508 [Hypothenemus hampei]|uniref:Crossover junction endonuclease MUS81 n=1 Tax=Hypothenemus hampei TaxID=57062 RepID=A0ABD1ER58_HYPHA